MIYLCYRTASVLDRMTSSPIPLLVFRRIARRTAFHWRYGSYWPTHTIRHAKHRRRQTHNTQGPSATRFELALDIMLSYHIKRHGPTYRTAAIAVAFDFHDQRQRNNTAAHSMLQIHRIITFNSGSFSLRLI